MSERLKRSVGAICMCCNIHDRDMKTMSDPEWLEVIGHPTIPHVQSLRAPPAQVAMHTSKESLIGLTNRKASRRYLEKLQKDRERNQEVLAECMDNLPIVIRQMVYPDKPSPTQTWRVGTGSHSTSREKKFRVGKQHQDDGFWQENIEQWVKSEQNNNEVGAENSNQKSLRRPGSHKSITSTQERQHERKNTLSYHSESESNGPVAKEFVHHPGFHGSTESSALKYKFGKKKSATTKEASSQPVTFKPKGFGSLYDELEFERRYKKVFDLNKHIHFVHSNFVTGQRIYKRNKLPPIGHIPSINSDPTDGQDIFAIMSVQKFNHPDGTVEPSGPVTSPRRLGTHGRQKMHRGADGFPSKPRHKRPTENPHEVDVPVGFVPGSVQAVDSSPFDGIKGNVMYKEGQSRLSMGSHEGDSALGTLTEETNPHNGVDDITCTQSEASFTSKKSKLTDDVRLFKQNLKKKRLSPPIQGTPDFKSENTFEDTAPFNISVHVEIKPKDSSMNGSDDVENDRAQERRHTIDERAESPRSDDSGGEMESVGENVTRPNNGTTTTKYGIITQKVRYPETFQPNTSTVSSARSAKLFSDTHDINVENSK